ncbi:hypothetical protein [Ralstonia pseudosolanacearum]
MIRKKSNAYKQIKANIAKLTVIQQTTGISPSLLVAAFLKNLPADDLFLKKKTKEEYWDWNLSDSSGYKYFKRASAAYLKKIEGNPQYQTMLEFFESNYLTKDYFGMTYSELKKSYYAQETPIKDFVREAFIAINPITPEMTPQERAIRNQKLGKISTQHWIGDIVHYSYFSQAPGFMMKNVEEALRHIEMYIVNLLNEKQLDYELMKLTTNQNLQENLITKEQPKKKVSKI